jgi:regulator of ribonuclease activity A
LKTADLCDRYPNELNICELSFRSYGKKSSFFGPISTVKVQDDNVLVLEAIESVPAGTVLVVDGGGSKRCALLGDRLASIAASRQLAGIIINGCVRDVSELSKIECGIFALGSMPLKSKKERKGETNVVVRFGGIDWTPGQYVYADEDGVVVSARKLEV